MKSDVKQKRIQDAYKEYYLRADTNGWIRWGALDPEIDFGFSKENIESNVVAGIWRHLSLKGIENDY